MKWLILVLFLCGCNYLYPQTRPRCPEVCFHLADIGCTDVFTGDAGSNEEFCSLKCKDRYGILNGMELKRCLVNAGTREEVEVCKEQRKLEEERRNESRVFRRK